MGKCMAMSHLAQTKGILMGIVEDEAGKAG